MVFKLKRLFRVRYRRPEIIVRRIHFTITRLIYINNKLQSALGIFYFLAVVERKNYTVAL